MQISFGMYITFVCERSCNSIKYIAFALLAQSPKNQSLRSSRISEKKKAC